MNTLTSNHRNKDGLTPTSVLLLRNPLDFIANDHLRLRAMCAQLDRMVLSPKADRSATEVMIEYLTHELPLLLADEDEDLMPRLLLRAEAEDELPKLADRLKEEHATIAVLLTQVMQGLGELVHSAHMTNPLRPAISDFANAARRHLILENAVLLPLARARLTDEDLQGLRDGMLKRRGLENLFC